MENNEVKNHNPSSNDEWGSLKDIRFANFEETLLAPAYEEMTNLIGKDSVFANDYIRQVRTEIIELSSNTADADYKTRMRKSDLEDILQRYEQRDTLICNEKDIDMSKILTLINSAPSMQEEDTFGDAPFARYQENTREAWEYVSDNKIRDYLSEKKFIHMDGLLQTGEAEDFKALIRANDKEEGISVPTGLFVNAVGFDSWLGRGSTWGINNGRGDKTMHSRYFSEKLTSIDTMKHYASLETELPPIGVANIYVQPDGTMFASNDAGGGDSHRIGAAMLRGDESIKCKNLQITLLKENIL